MGEPVVTVPPLATKGGVASDAVTLFLERARSARHDFELRDPHAAAAVTENCERVDGLPLGIELAAARMAARSAIEVRDRMADRFRLLQNGGPGPDRHLTLGHAVDWVELEVDNLCAGFRWSAGRGEVEVATDIAAHVALMGSSVELFETASL